MNESCNSSVKTDLLRRLRRLNQGQRKALRVEPGARCSYGMCLMPLDGPPAGIPTGNGSGGGLAGYHRRTATSPLPSSGNGGRNARSGRGWGRGKSARGGQGEGRGGSGGRRGVGIGGGSDGGSGGGGCYVFPCGHRFHRFCLGVSSEGLRRGGGGECSLCSRSKVLRR